jgi:hypothetical protein
MKLRTGEVDSRNYEEQSDVSGNSWQSSRNRR